MNLTVIGLNHKTAPVDLRERFAFSEEEIPSVLAEIRSQQPNTEAVLLSTCNRVEIYVYHPECALAGPDLARRVAELRGVKPDDLLPHLYIHHGREAVEHLFRVVCSLDSMVIGETEIKGQAARAYHLAADCGATGKTLNRLFEQALGVAKEARSSTAISERKVSVSSVAVDFAERIFQDFADKTVMIVGAGQTGEATLRHLVERGVANVIVANRSVEKAKALADDYGGKPVALDLLADYLPRADIVITSTSAPGHIIEPAAVRAAMRARKNRPMFLIDIAVPRDVNPEVNGIENVYLYDMDDLEGIVGENRAEREREVQRCEKIVAAAAEKFVRIAEGMSVDPTIAQLSDAMHGIMQAEMDKLLPKLEHLDEKDREQIALMADRIIHKILHGPVETLTQEARNGRATGYVDALKRLFGLGE
ncbi:MAG: glutamyl-tRNA reductase [Planctomycetota bacterium]